MAPPSGALTAVTVPWCCSTTWRTIARPRPLPERLREFVPREKRSKVQALDHSLLHLVDDLAALAGVRVDPVYPS